MPRIYAAAPGGGSGANVGVATVDFGSFPGKSDTSLAITGQAAIALGSSVIAQVFPKATSDHSVDEHVVEELVVMAGNISAGTGFTIYARTRNERLYGQWSVSWSWA